MNYETIITRFHAAQAFAREAGQLAVRLGRDRTVLGIESKGRQDLVTVADRAVEDLIRSRVRQQFGTDIVLGEEGGGRSSGASGEAVWVVDPIDGTVNFARGLPGWCVSIGIVVDGRPEIGVIYDPVADELFAARHGDGATLNGATIHVRSQPSLDDAIIGLGFSYRRATGYHADHVRHLLDHGVEYRRLGSGALSLAYVADGRLDGYIEQHCNAWDVLGGIVLVREAGGWTNDFLAQDGLANGNLIFACAPELRADLLRLVEPISGPV
ncbi:MAG TPA: inositol monophosphatase family protein, partial [Alphaproteobacteria bacterium]|nr:inositol monophosphatase family protein [Alphaproteobacteria bacterium]